MSQSGVTFVLGGARSGKSRFAENLAKELDKDNKTSDVYYIATAENVDCEIKKRIARHQKDRENNGWKTVEEPLYLADVIKKYSKEGDVVLIDCLTLWLNNIFYYNKMEQIGLLLDALSNTRNKVIIVSNEIGLGVIPVEKLSRDFIDEIGFLHQKIAAISTDVYFCTAGIANKIK